MGTLLSLWTVAVFVFFIAMLIWVIFIKKKEEMDEAANIPFIDDDVDEIKEGKHNG